MAIKRITTEVYHSDLSGEEGAETVKFGFHGANYELELTAKEAKEFEKLLTPYLNVARKATGRGTPAARSTGSKNTPEFLAKVREWAAAQGIEVAPRGRIKKDIIDQYNAAH